MSTPVGDGHAPRDGPPVAGRWLVGVVVGLLVIAGLTGAELWPMTGWKLFSVSRGETATRWVIEGHYADDTSRIVDLGELPVAYSNAEWPLRTVGGGSMQRAEELCQTLLAATVDADPDIVELAIARDSQELVNSDEGWTVTHDLDVRHTCTVTP